MYKSWGRTVLFLESLEVTFFGGSPLAKHLKLENPSASDNLSIICNQKQAGEHPNNSTTNSSFVHHTIYLLIMVPFWLATWRYTMSRIPSSSLAAVIDVQKLVVGISNHQSANDQEWFFNGETTMVLPFITHILSESRENVLLWPPQDIRMFLIGTCVAVVKQEFNGDHPLPSITHDCWWVIVKRETMIKTLDGMITTNNLVIWRRYNGENPRPITTQLRSGPAAWLEIDLQISSPVWSISSFWWWWSLAKHDLRASMLVFFLITTVLMIIKHDPHDIAKHGGED